MSEVTRQARLDNWSMFVMNRLQIFFNKTDYCDLTLQFEGNVQLKVHRVIMNACTEYFQVLEETCEVIDDVLIMPPDLQADVILPIVNFMYTGILEYQQSIYDKLYMTAQLMNMSVLLKFLDAQKVKNKVQRNTLQPAQPKRVPVKMEKFPSAPAGRKTPLWKRKYASVPVQMNTTKSYSPEQRTLANSDPLRFDNTPKPTRFEWPDDDIRDIKPFDLPLDSSFDRISYTTKPLLTQEEELRNTAGNSIFDDLRQLPTSKPIKLVKEFRKDHQSSSSVDMEDLKSYVKEHKRRSEYVADEDPDDPDYVPGGAERKRKLVHPTSYLKKVRLDQGDKEKENRKSDHSKIISEVLKKYPHLMQQNKNIRLKILTKNKSDEKESLVRTKSITLTTTAQSSPAKVKIIKQQLVSKKRDAETSWTCEKCLTNGKPLEFVLYYLYRKHMTDTHHKQFDARDCKHCGAQYEKPLHMAYHMYLSHAVTPHRSITFSRCDRCAYVAMTSAKMRKHMAFHAANAHHSQCVNCKLGFANEHCLKVHMQLAGHNGKNHISFDCQYCTRQLNAAGSLFVHLKTSHYDEAKKDGMLSLDQCDIDDEDDEDESAEVKESAKVSEKSEKKELFEVEEEESMKSNSQQSEQGEDQNLEQSLPFNIVVLNDEQQYILPEGAQQEGQEGFMALPQLQGQTYNINQADISSTDELVMVLSDHDYNDGNNEAIADNSNVVVLFSHPVQGQQNQFVATTQGNLLLNSETGLLELHNNALPITSQSETIELIQKEMEKHVSATSEILVDALAGTETNAEEEDEAQMEQPNAPKRVQVDDLPDRKVSIIGVEQSGTGQLLDTIEEISTGQDATEFVQTDGQTLSEVQLDEQMEVDAEPEKANVESNEEGPQEICSSQNSTLESCEQVVDSIEEFPTTRTAEDSEEKNEQGAVSETSQESHVPSVENESHDEVVESIETTEMDEKQTSTDNEVSVDENNADLVDSKEVSGTVENEISSESKKDDKETTVEEETPDNSSAGIGSLHGTEIDEIEFHVDDIEEISMNQSVEPTEAPHQESQVVEEAANESSGPTPSTEGEKDENISTLLHDWEDTDSQQSEQSKSASVNKLINDWDDD